MLQQALLAIQWATSVVTAERGWCRRAEAAVEDFSEAVRAMPGYGDGWKRRGQARAALGQPEAALADFTKALALVAEPRGRAEALAERGTLLQKQRDLRRAAKDLEEAASLDQGSKQVRRGCTALPAACSKSPAHRQVPPDYAAMLAQQQRPGSCRWTREAALTVVPRAAKPLVCADLFQTQD